MAEVEEEEEEMEEEKKEEEKERKDATRAPEQREDARRDSKEAETGQCGGRGRGRVGVEEEPKTHCQYNAHGSDEK